MCNHILISIPVNELPTRFEGVVYKPKYFQGLGIVWAGSLRLGNHPNSDMKKI